MDPKAVCARDAGLALISRINRWMIAGAVGVCGLISAAAANSFHGRTINSSSAAQSRQVQPSRPAPMPTSGATSSAGDSGGLQQPSVAPAPAPAPAPGASTPVVSGGS